MQTEKDQTTPSAGVTLSRCANSQTSLPDVENVTRPRIKADNGETSGISNLEHSIKIVDFEKKEGLKYHSQAVIRY